MISKFWQCGPVFEPKICRQNLAHQDKSEYAKVVEVEIL